MGRLRWPDNVAAMVGVGRLRRQLSRTIVEIWVVGREEREHHLQERVFDVIAVAERDHFVFRVRHRHGEVPPSASGSETSNVAWWATARQ